MNFLAKVLAISLLYLYLFLPISAFASPSISNAQKEVDKLRYEAAAKYEAANVVAEKIKQLQRETLGLQKQGEVLKQKLSSTKALMAKIAIENYKGNGFGQSMELLFSSDPKRYLSDAAIMEVLSKRYSKQLREFKTSQQQVQSSQILISDKLALVKAEQFKLNTQVMAAKIALAKAEKVLKSLKSEDRAKLLKDEAAKENQILFNSKKAANSFTGDGSRGSIALKFALDQIGDIYVWAAAGPTKWDCSGLTMRAFQRAGVSLPHSAALQYRFGKSIPYENVKPGDLLFFGTPISHVSIYMGKGQMVQAPRPGKKVEVVSLTRRFGYKPFVGAKRL
jgi:cell wall-associated NlpC family hydrolase